jgi:hypothetical protein
MMNRLESFSERREAKLLSRRSSTESSSSATAVRRPGSAHHHHHNDRVGDENRENSEALNPFVNANLRLNLRRVNGRLMVSPEMYDTLPQALPTENFYSRFPRAVGPLANVVVTTSEELQVLLDTCEPVVVVQSPFQRDVARRRLCREDILQGGFFVYQPKGELPHYFQPCEAPSPSEVYGTSTYIEA